MINKELLPLLKILYKCLGFSYKNLDELVQEIFQPHRGRQYENFFGQDYYYTMLDYGSGLEFWQSYLIPKDESDEFKSIDFKLYFEGKSRNKTRVEKLVYNPAEFSHHFECKSNQSKENPEGYPLIFDTPNAGLFSGVKLPLDAEYQLTAFPLDVPKIYATEIDYISSQEEE